METDATGTFVASSFSWATARDWARFGLLFLNDGIWKHAEHPNDNERKKNGKPLLNRVLPKGWVSYSSTPTPTSCGLYGAHWWLTGRSNEAEEARRAEAECDAAYPTRHWPPHDWVKRLPVGAMHAHGYEEQAVIVSPLHDAVVVRLGCLSEQMYDWDQVCAIVCVVGSVQR